MNSSAWAIRPSVLVTGASRGIGRAIAELLAHRGCRVAVHYRTGRAAAEAVAQNLEGDGHRAFAADLSSPEAVAGLWAEVTAAFGRIHVLVNNAGIYEQHPVLATSYADWQAAWQRTLATNLVGPANLCHCAGNAMAGHGGGRVVSISSRGAFRGEPITPAYGASKAGLNALSQSLALALAGQGVYFFVIAPGWVDTEMASASLAGPEGPAILAQHPLGRVASPQEVAAAAVFCALDAPPAMTGSIIDVNGASYLRT
jgi:NAD(P)-dependent dehydrogenase (short-subunit alcohol dehydrogenase family)